MTTPVKKRVQIRKNSPKDIARARDYAVKNPEKIKAASAKYRTTEKYVINLLNKNLAKYGLTFAEYSAMLESQASKCKICGGDDTKRKGAGRRVHQPLAIDHCHTTGKVRGLLCTNCNVALGLFKDSPELMINAISYLKGA